MATFKLGQAARAANAYVVMGVLLYTNDLTRLNNEAINFLNGIGLDFSNV